MADRELWVVDCGLRAYAEMLDLQRSLARARIGGEIDQDVLLLVEHPPVITLGRSTKDAHLVANPDQLRTRSWWKGAGTAPSREQRNDQPTDVLPSTWRKTTIAFCMSSIVPSEIRA